MTFDDLIFAVDQLTPEQLAQLQTHIAQRFLREKVHPISADERIRLLREAAAIIREGLSVDELADMIEAMNAEYVEDVEEDVWRD